MTNDKSGKTKGSEKVIIRGEDFTDTDPTARVIQEVIGGDVVSRYQINLVLKTLRQVEGVNVADPFGKSKDDAIKLHDLLTVTLSAKTTKAVQDEIARQSKDNGWTQTAEEIVNEQVWEHCDAMAYDYIAVRRA